MNRNECLGYHVARFFTNRLAGELGASPATVASYRDAIKLLVSYLTESTGRPPEAISVDDLNGRSVRGYLDWLESDRGCSPSTRNQRLAAVKSLCRWIMADRPELIDGLSEVVGIRKKKGLSGEPSWLRADEVKALLAAPGQKSWISRRDTVLLSVLYDSGARAQEICDLALGDVRGGDPLVVVLHGKGSKVRGVPLMGRTASLLEEWIDRLQPNPGVATSACPVFPSQRGRSKLSRWGVACLLAKYVEKIRASDPAFGGGRRVTPHTLRHSKAIHLVQAGVNLVYIRDLLGHAHVSTTEIYARIDDEMKRKALEDAYDSLAPEKMPDWREDRSLLAWLDSLGLIADR